MVETDSYKHLIKKFVVQNIIAASYITESMNEKEVAIILQILPSGIAIQVIKNLQISFAAALLKNFDDNVLEKVLPKLEPQLLTTILMHISKAFRERIKKHISGEIEGQIRDLLEYPEGSIVRVVTMDFLSFDKNILARDAISKIRSLFQKRRPASYAYVVDDKKHLSVC